MAGPTGNTGTGAQDLGQLGDQFVYNGGTNQTPVAVPDSSEMAHEPAITLAKAQQVMNAIFLVLGALGVVVTTQIAGAAGTILPAAFTIYSVLYGVWAAHHQGQVTRAAVYSPASVAAKVSAASSANLAGIPSQTEQPGQMHAPGNVPA